jgi:hypothetical protein
MASDSDPKVTPVQPQTDKALNIKDPSSVDETVTFTYDPASANFAMDTYKTYTQDTSNIQQPAAFFSSDDYAPSTSPFILEITGKGFDGSSQTNLPLIIWMQVGNYLAAIPQLQSSTDLKIGNAFGYVIKSPTTLWIYLSRLLFQKIWFPYDEKTFQGIEDSNKTQLESGNAKYPFISSAPNLTIWVSINNGKIHNQPFYFKAPNAFESIDINVTQSPFVMTLKGNKLNGAIYPNAFKDSNGSLAEVVYLFGHQLLKNVGGSKQRVMMVKTSSTLLKKYPSAFPKTIVDEVQDKTAVHKLTAQQLSTLDYFKGPNSDSEESFFLGALDTFKPKFTFKNYIYLLPSGVTTNSGKNNGLPPDPLTTVQFSIKTLPAGTYQVVVYDGDTGDYDIAPVVISIGLRSGKMQIHDVSPQTIVPQSPSFTVNGFNFPLPDDINNGAVFTVSLADASQEQAIVGKNINSVFGPTAFLQIDKAHPTNSKNGNGSITLSSDSQFIAKFENLHVTNDMLSKLADNSFKLFAEVTYAKPNVAKGKVNEAALSDPLQFQRQPLINFLTNAAIVPPDGVYNKSLVRVDQATGQVIAYGTVGPKLYIVGKNFEAEINDTKAPVSVLIGGVQQKITDSFSWPHDSTLRAIEVKVDPSNIKGDVTVEVKVGSASSEAFQFYQTIQFTKKAVTTNAKGKFTKEDALFPADQLFKPVLPYNQFDQHILLNSTNTKVSSSVKLSLSNSATKQSVNLNADLNSSVALSFLPDEIHIPAKTPLLSDGSLPVTLYFSNLYNVNISTPKIFRLYHENPSGTFGGLFNPNENMIVVGNGFVNGMRYNINDAGWSPVSSLGATTIDKTVYQTFTLVVPDSKGKTSATLRLSNDQAASVSSKSTSGKQNGSYKVGTINVNDKYSPLLKINQRLPAGIKMYAKGPQVAMTDRIDANMSIFSQITPFLGSFKTLLIVIRIIVCIIDVICALINPFQLIVAIIALMDCIIDLLSLFPQLAVPIMILSFLQNFIGFLQTFIQQIEAYVFSIVNSQLALVKAQLSKDFALLAAAEQQAFGCTKQIRDVISFLEPALQIIQIFKDLLNFAMHFPCAGNQGSAQDDGTCPPGNMQKLINEVVQDKTVAPNTYTVNAGGLVRKDNTVTATTTIPTKLTADMQIMLTPGEKDFPTGIKTILDIVDPHTFTYTEEGADLTSTVAATIDTVVSPDQQATLATMFCQAVAMQTATLQTMPGFNGLDSFGNPLPGGPLGPGSTSVIPTLTPILPNVAAAIECMNNFTDQIDAALNAGQTFVTTAEQGQALVNAYIQCVQNLIDQTNQALGDVCVLAVSALNSELKVSPKGRIGPNLSDDFIKTKIGFPSTDPTDQQDSGLTLDLAQLGVPKSIPSSIISDPNTGASSASQNFGTKQDIYTPIIFQSTNKSGHRQSPTTIYFNADNQDVGGLITVGDIIEIVGGTFSGLQFPIIGIQQVFTAVRLTCKLDLTFEQKLLVGEQPLPENLSGFDVKIIAHLAGNDAVAVVPADDSSVATVQIFARDHHGHEIGAGLANKVAIKIESGDGEFVPVIPSSTTDVTGVIQESGTHYIANIKANCAGTVIVSSSVCGIEFVDIGYHTNDPAHAITTRRKTVKIIFTPPIPKPTPAGFDAIQHGQIPGTDFVN